MLRFLPMLVLIGCSQGNLPPAILETIYHFISGFSTHPDNPFLDQIPTFKEYDFIVVGAGSSGSVVTNRLTENPNWSVLLLEEGKDEIFLTDVPLLAPVLHITDYMRLYRSEARPQNPNGTGGYCLAMKEGRCNLPNGKAVGGTSVVNFMIYSRGSPTDYDAWEAEGNPGWSYQDVLPYFLKSENCKLVHKDVRFHNRGGYLDVTTPPYVSPLRDRFLHAGRELGYDTIDYNGEKLIGFSTAQVHLRNGHRVSASKAFLRPIRDRKNFYLSKFSKVTRIIIDPRTKIALGVEFVKGNKKHFAYARKEVILSAGTLNSPQILMLSGVGPKDHLKSLGINAIEDLPVGFNLQDHVSMSALTFLVNESVTVIEPRLAMNPVNTLDYLIKGTGPLTLPGGAECLAFINTKQDKPKTTGDDSMRVSNGKNTRFNSTNRVPQAPKVSSITVNRDFSKTYLPTTNKSSRRVDVPDMELVLGISALTGDTSGSYRGLLGLSDEFYKEVFGAYEGYDAFTIVPVLLQPKSRGRVTLKSTDPFHWPIFDINYYDHEEDLATMIRGIKKAIEIASTRSFRRYNTTLFTIPFPGCKNHVFKSDEYWGCVARQVSTTLGHFVGTCKMGTRRNSGVVDHRLRVHGLRALRVVDASVIPTIIAGHTNAPAYMIAEKAADMIKEDWTSSDDGSFERVT